MRIARVIGTVTATVKEVRLSAHPLLLIRFEDEYGNQQEPTHVAVDMLGAGVGQQVLVTTGSSARVPTQLQGLAADAAIVAIIDEVSVGK